MFWLIDEQTMNINSKNIILRRPRSFQKSVVEINYKNAHPLEHF